MTFEVLPAQPIVRAKLDHDDIGLMLLQCFRDRVAPPVVVSPLMLALATVYS